MPTPSADYITKMLNPYAGFSTADSARTGIMAGSVAASARQNVNALAQQKELAMADDQRARDYMGMQQKQWQTGRDDEQKALQIKAFSEFQAAIDAGDLDGADLAANKLRAMGVDVQSYGAADKFGSSSALGQMAQRSPTAMVDRARSGAAPQTPESYDPNDSYGKPPPTAAERATSRALDKVASSATVPVPVSAEEQRRIDAEGERIYAENEAEMAGKPGSTSRAPPGPSNSKDPYWRSRDRPGEPGSGYSEEEARAQQRSQKPTGPYDSRDIYWRSKDRPGEPGSGYDQEEAEEQRKWELRGYDKHGIPFEQSGKAPAGLESRLRPGPSRVGGLPSESSAASDMSGAATMNYDPEANAAAGDRPDPSRSSFIGGQEPGGPQGSPLRGYRVSFGGQTIDIDPQSVLQRQQNRVAGIMRPIVANARTAEERNAAETAYEEAVRAVEVYGPEKAAQLGLQMFQHDMDRSARTKNTRINRTGSASDAGDGYGGVEGNTKDRNAVLSQLNDDIRAEVQGIESRNDVPGIRKAINAGEKVDSLITSGNALGQRAALTQTLKQWFSSVTSNKELDFLLTGNGKFSQLEAEFNAYANGGELPAGFIGRLSEVTKMVNDMSRRKLHEIGQNAVRSVIGNFSFTERMTPEQQKTIADNIFGRFTGQFAPPEEKKTEEEAGAAPAKGGKAKPKAAGGKKKSRSEQAADDLLK